MYNLNVNLAAAASNAVNNLLNVDNLGCNTPRTPEILNSLIAMTNPLDNYQFGDSVAETKPSVGPPTSLSSDSNSSTCSQVESPTNAPPSIQHTCSQLIKAGLKLSIEQKRKHQSDGEELLDLDKIKRIKKSDCSENEDEKQLTNGLTPEDEERRRRRRERNKIAATKCRLKKRERTANLITESETLETQNIELKSQLQELEKQRFELANMLTSHRPNCQKRIPKVTRDHIFNHRLPPVSVIDTSHSYTRPASVEVTSYQNASLEVYNRPSSVEVSSYNRTNNIQYIKPPSIIVESPDYEPHLTNLDDPLIGSEFIYNHQQCHNYGSSPNYVNQGLDSGCMA